MRLPLPLLLPLLLLGSLLSGCADNPTVVSVLLADESSAGSLVDRERLEQRVEQACDECEVKAYDAGGDEAEQRRQLQQALAESADAIVIEPLAPDVADGIDREEVPLVAVGLPAAGADAFAGLDTEPPSVAADDLTTARDVVMGRERTMTYVPVAPMTDRATGAALTLLVGDELTGAEDVDGVPGWTFETTTVDRNNLTTVLVGEHVLTVGELCEGATRKKCIHLGLF